MKSIINNQGTGKPVPSKPIVKNKMIEYFKKISASIKETKELIITEFISWRETNLIKKKLTVILSDDSKLTYETLRGGIRFPSLGGLWSPTALGYYDPDQQIRLAKKVIEACQTIKKSNKK